MKCRYCCCYGYYFVVFCYCCCLKALPTSVAVIRWQDPLLVKTRKNIRSRWLNQETCTTTNPCGPWSVPTTLLFLIPFYSLLSYYVDLGHYPPSHCTTTFEVVGTYLPTSRLQPILPIIFLSPNFVDLGQCSLPLCTLLLMNSLPLPQVGGGLKSLAQSGRPMENCLPK